MRNVLIATAGAHVPVKLVLRNFIIPDLLPLFVLQVYDRINQPSLAGTRANGVILSAVVYEEATGQVVFMARSKSLTQESAAYLGLSGSTSTSLMIYKSDALCS